MELIENYISIVSCSISLPAPKREHPKRAFTESMKNVLEKGYELFINPPYRLEDIDEIVDLIWKILENSSKIALCQRKCRKDDDHFNLKDLSMDLFQRLLNDDEYAFVFYSKMLTAQIVISMISAVSNFTNQLSCVKL